jgi:hypothetical protein
VTDNLLGPQEAAQVGVGDVPGQAARDSHC